MHKVIYLFFFFSLFSWKGYAQDFLVPAPTVWECLFVDYEQDIKRILLSDSEGNLRRCDLRFWAQPAFTPPYVLELCGGQLTYKVAQQTIWDYRIYDSPKKTKRRRNIKVNTIQRYVPDTSRKVLQNLFRTALLKTHFPEEGIRKGCDGADYYFSWKNGFDLYIATVWSPAAGSNTAELVAICEDIIECLKKENENILEFPPGLLKRMQVLEKKMSTINFSQSK